MRRLRDERRATEGRARGISRNEGEREGIMEMEKEIICRDSTNLLVVNFQPKKY